MNRAVQHRNKRYPDLLIRQEVIVELIRGDWERSDVALGEKTSTVRADRFVSLLSTLQRKKPVYSSHSTTVELYTIAKALIIRHRELYLGKYHVKSRNTQTKKYH